VQQRGRLDREGSAWSRKAARLLENAGRASGLTEDHEISLVICDNPTIRRINRRWRNIDRPTDVLSFPLHDLPEGAVPPPGPVGDVVISLPTLRRAAREMGIALDEHLEHLVAHGLLHLLGYDHKSDGQAARMERMERRLMRVRGTK